MPQFKIDKAIRKSVIASLEAVCKRDPQLNSILDLPRGAPKAEDIDPGPGPDGTIEELKKSLIMPCMTADDVDRAIMLMIDANPSEAQKRAGNYRKAHISIHGVEISIETPRGSMRTGVGGDGKAWSVVMPDHYGYARSTVGADGDAVDVTIGRDHSSPVAYIIDQHDPGTGQFDEHKCFVWFESKWAAIKSYDASFSDGSGPRRRASVTALDWPAAFKAWLVFGDTKSCYGVPLATSAKSDIYQRLQQLADRRGEPLDALLAWTGHRLAQSKGQAPFQPEPAKDGIPEEDEMGWPSRVKPKKVGGMYGTPVTWRSNLSALRGRK